MSVKRTTGSAHGFTGSLSTLVFLLILTSYGNFLFTQEDTSKQELLDLIRDVEQDIDKEQSELKRIKTRSSKKIKSIRTNRKSTADDLISLRRNIDELDQRIEDAEKTEERLRKETENLERELDRARNLFPLLRSVIRRWTEKAPPSRKRSEQKAGLKEANELMQSGENPVRAVEKCIHVLVSLLREGRRAQLLDTSIRTPDGRLRDVELLRLGRAFVAYRTRDNGEYGIRVNGENGFRWWTNLTGSQKKRIDSAIEKLSSGERTDGFTRLTLPLDPTQEMSKEYGNTASRTFYERLYAGGPVMIPLALIAFISLVLILERFWTLSGETTDVNALLRDVQSALSEGDFDRATTICEDTPGAVPAVLNTLINARNERPDTTQDRVEEAILKEMPRLERFLPSLNVLAGVAPLLGLLGTVTGIIETFDVIAVFGEGNQQLMAGGISEALMTTATGLVIAIPVLLFHGYFRSRVDTIVGNMERTAATVYNFLQSERDTGAGEDVPFSSG